MESLSSLHSLRNPELREQYQRAGFGGRVGWGERPALLVIDMARNWTDPGEQMGSDLAAVLRSIVDLLAAARARTIPIFFTTIAFDPALKELGNVVRRKVPQGERLIRGHERVQLVPELDRREDEPLIEKPRGSAFFGTNLLSMLIDEKVDTTIVTGCSTSGCIRATCTDAHDRNFHVIVPAEAVGDRSRTAHEANLFDVHARYGDVLPLREVLEQLANLRGTNEEQEAAGRLSHT